jgi:hypothetical protein
MTSFATKNRVNSILFRDQIVWETLGSR